MNLFGMMIDATNIFSALYEDSDFSSREINLRYRLNQEWAGEKTSSFSPGLEEGRFQASLAIEVSRSINSLALSSVRSMLSPPIGK